VAPLPKREVDAGEWQGGLQRRPGASQVAGTVFSHDVAVAPATAQARGERHLCRSIGESSSGSTHSTAGGQRTVATRELAAAATGYS